MFLKDDCGDHKGNNELTYHYCDYVRGVVTVVGAKYHEIDEQVCQVIRFNFEMIQTDQ